MRSEQMERLRRKAVSDRDAAIAAGGTHPLDVNKPWDLVWEMAANDVSFWKEEFEDFMFSDEVFVYSAATFVKANLINIS